MQHVAKSLSWGSAHYQKFEEIWQVGSLSFPRRRRRRRSHFIFDFSISSWGETMVEIGLSNYYVVDERALRSCGINMTTSEDWTRLSWTSVWTSWVALAAICVFLFLKFTVSFLRQAIRKSKKSQGISSLRYVPFLKWLRGRHKCVNCKRCYFQIC